ncbi:MAG: MaoC/PaaZ C-terminal domain-containing protein, partial [Betaproteobacteria bacterium]
MTTVTTPASSVFEALAAAQYAPVEQCVTARDAMLYALGIGFGEDPVDASQLKFVYEKDLRVFPTMAVTLCYASADKRTHAALDMRKVLHAFQGFELHAPIPLECPLEGQTRITGVYDKGADRGVLWTYETLVREKASGTLVCTLSGASMSLLGGGVGGPRGESRPKKPGPSRAPDAVCDFATLPQAALIYRLSGDYNPFHVDPEMARQGGFPRPILHGRCTFGIAGRAIVREICAGDERRLRKMEARFSSPVFPGETIRTEMWKEGTTVE